MRFDQFLLEYDRSQTIKNFGEKVLAAAAKDQSIDFAAILAPFAEEGQTNYRMVLQRSPEAQQTLINYVMGVIEQSDPTKQKSYAQAITRLYGMGNTLLEDIATTLGQYLVKYDKLKKKKKVPPEFNDFMRFKSVNDFMTAVEAMPDPDSEIEQQKVAATQLPPHNTWRYVYGSMDQAGRIISDVLIIQPLDQYGAYWWAKEYPKKGVTNRWCTAWEGTNSRFDYYSNQGPLYIIIPAKRKDENEKYQFHFQTKQFMDYQDHQIGDNGMDALAQRFPALTQIFHKQAIEFNILGLMTPEFKQAVKDYAVTAGTQLDELLTKWKPIIAGNPPRPKQPIGFDALAEYGITLPEETKKGLIPSIEVYIDQFIKALSAKGGFWDKVRDTLGSERDESKLEVMLNTDILLKGAMDNSRAAGLIEQLAKEPDISRRIDPGHLQDMILRDPLFRFIMKNVPRLYKDFLNQLETGAKQGINESTGLTFMGSPCTKDCSGHQAGYKWSLDRGGRVANGHSNSFNNGTNIAATVSKKRKQGGGKLPGYVSQTKDAIRKRAARAFGKTTLGQDPNLQEQIDFSKIPVSTLWEEQEEDLRQLMLKTPDTDQILYHLTSAFRKMQKHADMYNNFDNVERVYNFLRSSLMQGDYEDFSSSYAEAMRNHPDVTSELVDEMFSSAGLDHNATIEDFFATISEQGVAEGKVKDFAIQKSERDEMSPQQFFGQYGKTKDMWDRENSGMFTSKIKAKKKVTTPKKTARALDYCTACGRADNRCICESMTEGRAYYNVVGTTDEDLQKQFGMRKDAAGWYLNENVDKKKHATAYRAFGAPKLKEYNLASFSGDAATRGEDNVVGPLTKQIKRK